jgi:hypothetical protein
MQSRGFLASAEAVELMLDNQFGYPNPLVQGDNGSSSMPNVFTRVLADGKGQYKRFIIGERRNNFAPIKSVCEDLTVGAAKPTRTVTIQPQTYGGSGSFCASDITALCNAYTGSTLQKALSPLVNSNDEIIDAVIAQNLRDYASDFGQVVWFSKKGIAVSTASSAAPFYITSLEAGAQTMLGAIDGFWARLQALAVAGDVPLVNLNNGSAKGAVNPDTVATYLRDMVNKASVELRNAAGAEKPFFLVDRAIFEALKKYLEARNAGSEAAYNSMISQAAAGVMMFEGYMVYLDSAADKFDTIVGAKVTSTITSTSYGAESITHSRNLRAVFMSPGQMGFASDLNTPTGYGAEGAGVYAWAGSPETKDQGRVNWISYMTAGVEVFDPRMFVVGYPSNAATFV